MGVSLSGLRVSFRFTTDFDRPCATASCTSARAALDLEDPQTRRTPRTQFPISPRGSSLRFVLSKRARSTSRLRPPRSPSCSSSGTVWARRLRIVGRVTVGLVILIAGKLHFEVPASGPSASGRCKNSGSSLSSSNLVIWKVGGQVGQVRGLVGVQQLWSREERIF